MRNWYREWFYIPKHSKEPIREKALLSRIGVSVAMILLCMIAMSLTAYAYFTHSIRSADSTVRAARWEITVQAEPDVTVTEGKYLLDNQNGAEDRTYTFTVAKDTERSTATVGYVKIVVITDTETEQPYYTQPIGNFLQNGVTVTDLDRQVTVTVPAGKSATVSFIAKWGSCAMQPIEEEADGILPTFKDEPASSLTDGTTVTTTTAATTVTTTTTAATTVTTTTTAETTTTAATTVTTTAEVTTTTAEPTTTTQAEVTTATAESTTTTTEATTTIDTTVTTTTTTVSE